MLPPVQNSMCVVMSIAVENVGCPWFKDQRAGAINNNV